MSTPDARMATRALRAARGLLDTALVTGELDLAALSQVLPSLGLMSSVSDAHVLSAPLLPSGSAAPTRLVHQPWPGPSHARDGMVLAHGSEALVDAALRLAAAHAMGRAPARLPFIGPPVRMETEPLLQLVGSWQDRKAPVCLVVGQASHVLDLLSPAPRDLAPVLGVLASRLGVPAPANEDAACDLLPALFAQDAGLRDERVRNDARAGVFSTAGGALVDVGALDADAVDARVETAVRGADAAVVCAEPDLVPQVLELLGPRVRAVLVLAPASITGGGVLELPARVVDAATGQACADLLADAAVQSRDLPSNEGVVTGEVAVASPGLLLAGAARRAVMEAKAPVMDAAVLEAIASLQQARGGLLPARARLTVALHRADLPVVARAVAAVFLGAQLGGRAGASSAPAQGVPSRKVRIKG